MTSALWHTHTRTGYPPRLIAYYDPDDEPPRKILWNANYGNIKQPYLRFGNYPSTHEAHLVVPPGTNRNALIHSTGWEIKRGFQTSVDPETDATWKIADLVGQTQFTHDIFTGCINGVEYPIDYRVETSIFDPNTGDPVYFGLDSTRKALFANYFYPSPNIVGGNGTSRGDVLAATGHLGGDDWARLLSHLPGSPSYYQTRGVVIDRGDGPERARAIRGPASRSSLSQGLVLPKASPQSLYVGPPSSSYIGQGYNNGMNPLNFGLPPSVRILWTTSQSDTYPDPEWRAKLQLWTPTTSYSSPVEISLGSGTMDLDGNASGIDYFYHEETYDLTGYDISGYILFQVKAEAKPGYTSYWSIGNSHPQHKSPCGWPLWAIGERPEFEVPFIPAPLFKRA